MKKDYKFVLAVAAMFLLPFLLLSRHFLYGNRDLRMGYTLSYMEMRTVSSSRMISEALNSRYSLAALAADPRFKSGGKQELLQRKVAEAPFIYSELALLSSKGKELARAAADKKASPGLDYAGLGVFAAAQRTLGPAGAVEYSEYTPPALILAEPVKNAAGKPEYFLAGRLSLAYLGELVRLLGRNSHGNMGLVDAGGQVVADSARMSSLRPGMKVPVEISAVLAAAVSGGVMNLSRPVKGKGRPYLVSVSNVPGSAWWLYEIVDTARMPAYRTPYRAVKIVLSGVMLILIFSVVTYKLADRWLLPREEERR